MTGTERKRAWRLRNPERRRTAERDRALARRRGHYGRRVLGTTPRPCTSSESYMRYEQSMKRCDQRFWYPIAGAGAHRLTKEQRAARIKAKFERLRDELAMKYGTLTGDEAEMFELLDAR
jgi:hypothetical protein